MATPSRSKRGFAGMDPERQKEIARRGGLARNKSRQNDANNKSSQSSKMNDLM